MLAQKAGAAGASGMIAPMPTMAMGCRPDLPGWVESCGLVVISLSPSRRPSRRYRAGAPVQDVGDAVHIGYQSFLCRARGVEPEAGAGGRRGVAGEHPAHRGERCAVESVVSLLRQLTVERRRGTGGEAAGAFGSGDQLAQAEQHMLVAGET